MEWNDDIEAGMEITLLSVTNMSEDDTCKLHVELLRPFAYEPETSETDTETDSLSEHSIARKNTSFKGLETYMCRLVLCEF